MTVTVNNMHTHWKHVNSWVTSFQGWRPECGWWLCLAADCGSKVRLFRQWAAANCAALPTANVNHCCSG